MTRRYRSFRSEVAKRPPSSGTSGRRSGGSTGSTVRTIHSGLLPDSMNDSSSFRRLDRRLSLVSEVVPPISSRILITLGLEVERAAAARARLRRPCARRTRRRAPRCASRYISSVSSWPRCSRRHARIDDHEGLEIQHALDLAQRHVEHQADARRQRLQEPDVRGRAGQLDVAHALAAHLGLRDLDAALLADHAAVLEALVLAAQALVVLHRPEDLGAEQAVALGLEGAVVDGLGLAHFAVGPGADHLRRGQADLDRVELLDRGLLLEELE